MSVARLLPGGRPADLLLRSAGGPGRLLAPPPRPWDALDSTWADSLWEAFARRLKHNRRLRSLACQFGYGLKVAHRASAMLADAAVDHAVPCSPSSVAPDVSRCRITGAHADWTELSDEATARRPVLRSRAHDRRQLARTASGRTSTTSSPRAGCPFGRTSGSRPNGSRRTVFPGIAIPFYLAHPRLDEAREVARCWRSKAARRNGACRFCGTRPDTRSTTPTTCADAGAACGSSAGRSSRIPTSTLPRPYSKSFVLHLDSWYAQSHPGRGFRRDVRRVADAGQRLARALRRLARAAEARILDELMAEIAGQPPVVSHAAPCRADRAAANDAAAPLRAASARTTASSIRTSTIAICVGCSRADCRAPTQHESLALHPLDPPRRAPARRRVDRRVPVHDRPRHRGHDRARGRAEPAAEVYPEDRTKLDFTMLVTVQTMNYLHSGRHRTAL